MLGLENEFNSNSWALRDVGSHRYEVSTVLPH